MAINRLKERGPALESAKARFPDLVQTAGLKVNGGFNRLIKCLSHSKVLISNPGPLIVAPFLDQLWMVEALHTYVNRPF